MFDGVIGHGGVIELLDAELQNPAQAYLFVGPNGVGKATIGRKFAAGLIAAGDENAIGRVMAGIHPDLALVEPEGRTSVTVEQARAIVARAVLAPVEADRKVILLEEAGAMTDEAANALLKTLEEPTETTVFILITESELDLPPTVASRSRTIHFGRVPDGDIESALVDSGVAEDQASRVAVTAAGRPGLGLMLATRPEVAAFRRSWLSVPSRLDEMPGTAFRLAGEMVAAAEPLLEGISERQSAESEIAAAEGREAKATKERHDRERKRATAALHAGGLEILASWYRDAAAAQFGAPVRNRDISGADLAGVPASTAVGKAKRVLATIASLETNQRPDLAFAALFADLGTPT